MVGTACSPPRRLSPASPAAAGGLWLRAALGFARPVSLAGLVAVCTGSLSSRLLRNALRLGSYYEAGGLQNAAAALAPVYTHFYLFVYSELVT